MNIPLFLTSSRVVLALIVGSALLLESAVPFHVTIAAVCFIVAALTDFLDGNLARRWNQTTKLGAFLDPLADKLLVYLSFVYLTTVQVYPVWLFLLLFIRDMVTDSLRGFAAGEGISMPANPISKLKSLFQMVSIGLLLILVSITELQKSTAWGNNAFASLIASSGFDKAFGATYWLMLAAGLVGIVGTIQYIVEYAPKLFKKSHHA